jgi:alkanesulfonate monooxygenase SsuD/methylene tetrahydromethanopterin reductase-like flavin-dependent oxidoreductase (luciferase family)
MGRDPQSIKIVAGLLVIVAETDEKAREKYELLASYGDREGALALFGGWSGYDLGKYGDDEDFRFLVQRRQLSEAWSITGRKVHPRVPSGTRRPLRNT